MTGWTEQRPKAPGWYWWRGKYDTDTVERTVPVQVKLENGELWAIAFGDQYWGRLNTAYVGLWHSLPVPP
jgi:hypothetical protein